MFLIGITQFSTSGKLFFFSGRNHFYHDAFLPTFSSVLNFYVSKAHDKFTNINHLILWQGRQKKYLPRFEKRVKFQKRQEKNLD